MLTSFAPVQPVAEHAVMVPMAARVQPCNEQNAPIRLIEVVYDSRGYPFGEVAAWSCSSVADATAEFNRRKAEMQAAAP